jgi:membrane protease subunit (stomatin/prohibitin family)
VIPGLSGHVFDGVFFSEQGLLNVPVLVHCTAHSNIQNTNIDSLKRTLAAQAKAAGANTIINFKYAQRANFMSMSSVSWDATGDAVFLSVDGAAAPAASAKFCPKCGGDVSATAKFCRGCGNPLG